MFSLRIAAIAASLSFLAACASTVEVDHTPAQTCERWCVYDLQCGPSASPDAQSLCVEHCGAMAGDPCAEAVRAEMNCIVDTYNLSHACDGSGLCRCQDLIDAAQACRNTAAR